MPSVNEFDIFRDEHAALRVSDLKHLCIRLADELFIKD